MVCKKIFAKKDNVLLCTGIYIYLTYLVLEKFFFVVDESKKNPVERKD